MRSGRRQENESEKEVVVRNKAPVAMVTIESHLYGQTDSESAQMSLSVV